MTGQVDAANDGPKPEATRYSTLEDFVVPKIDSLDPKNTNYVTHLDEGYLSLLMLFKALVDYEPAAHEHLVKTTVNKLESIGAVSREDFRFFIDGSKPYTLVDGIVEPLTKKFRDTQDIIRGHDRKIHELHFDIESKFLAIERSFADFRFTLLGLTEITPLVDPNYNNKTNHYYIVHANGVYECHARALGRANEITIPIKLDRIPPEILRNENYLAELKTKAGGINANIYRVTNPSKVLPLNFTAYYAHKLSQGRLTKDRTDEDEKRSPVDYFVERIKKAINKLK